MIWDGSDHSSTFREEQLLSWYTQQGVLCSMQTSKLLLILIRGPVNQNGDQFAANQPLFRTPKWLQKIGGKAGKPGI